VTVERVDWEDPRAVALRDAMEDEMNTLYAPLADSLADGVMEQLSVGFDVLPGTIVAAVLAVDGEVAVGQAGLRPHGDALEVKKVVVDPEHRGRGASRLLMTALEDAARQLGIRRLILQTGPLQPAAIALYEKIGYVAIEPYPPYELMPGALCYEKILGQETALD